MCLDFHPFSCQILVWAKTFKKHTNIMVLWEIFHAKLTNWAITQHQFFMLLMPFGSRRKKEILSLIKRFSHIWLQEQDLTVDFFFFQMSPILWLPTKA